MKKYMRILMAILISVSILGITPLSAVADEVSNLQTLQENAENPGVEAPAGGTLSPAFPPDAIQIGDADISGSAAQGLGEANPAANDSPDGNPSAQGLGGVNPVTNNFPKANPSAQGLSEANPAANGSTEITPTAEGSGETNPISDKSEKVNPTA